MVQPDGKIVVAGCSSNGGNHDFALVRYNGDGSLDLSFGATGMVTTPFRYDDCGQSMTLQPDGKIVVAGYSHNGSSNDFALARYNSDGSLDPSFGTAGKVITPVGSFDNQARTVAVQSDGKIVVAGCGSNGNSYRFAVVARQ